METMKILWDWMFGEMSCYGDRGKNINPVTQQMYDYTNDQNDHPMCGCCGSRNEHENELLVVADDVNSNLAKKGNLQEAETVSLTKNYFKENNYTSQSDTKDDESPGSNIGKASNQKQNLADEISKLTNSSIDTNIVTRSRSKNERQDEDELLLELEKENNLKEFVGVEKESENGVKTVAQALVTINEVLKNYSAVLDLRPEQYDPEKIEKFALVTMDNDGYEEDKEEEGEYEIEEIPGINNPVALEFLDGIRENLMIIKTTTGFSNTTRNLINRQTDTGIITDALEAINEVAKDYHVRLNILAKQIDMTNPVIVNAFAAVTVEVSGYAEDLGSVGWAL